MRRLVFIILFLMLMLMLGFFSLRERPLPKADFTYALGDEIKTLDPAQAAWNKDIRIALGLWEGLASYHPETSAPVEGAAKLPPQISEDGLVYTFTLREEARWSNGDPVTAEDFIYGWRRAIEPGIAKDYAFLVEENISGAKEYVRWRNQAVKTLSLLRDLYKGRPVSPEDRQFIDSLALAGAQTENPNWEQIAGEYRRGHLAEQEARFRRVGLKALDEKHLQVTLARPIAYFLDLVPFSTLLPVHKKSLERLRMVPENPMDDLTLWNYDPQWAKPDYHHNGYPGVITNGPYQLKAWKFKQYMLFEKNPYYWDRDRVKSETILSRIIMEPSTSFLAYEQGEIDFIDEVTRLDFAPKLVELAKEGMRKDIHIRAAFGTYFYYFNCLERLPDGSKNPFRDRRVRMAFNLAVDKKALAEKVKKIGNPPAYNLIPPDSIPGYSCPPGPGYDPERARQMLAECGYPQGQGLPTIEILYNSGMGHETTAQAIAEMWEKNLQIKTALRGKELKTFDDDKENQRFMVLRASWFGDYNDPTTFLDMLTTGNGNNDAGFSLPEYDALVKKAETCRDAKERMAILAQAENMLIQEQVPFMALYYYVNLLAYRPEVKGVYPNARDMYPFKYIYVEK
ncbi:MAG: Periplasmic oligopeptide-binding protein precursor [Planctomycetes bacterium ADurb.Bin412]|nr:MAG: Periplasmic oligopeptide-binding protein precursor [Planctomycetes bacterium ADurb.Bin412]